MSLRSGLSVLVVLSSCAVLAMSAGVAHSDPAGSDQERLQIDAETQRLEEDFVAELAACATRFAVTDCSDEVRSRRRATLEPLRERRQALDDAERSARAAARLAAIENKRRAQRANVPEPPPPRLAMAAAALPASSPLIVVRRQPAAARQNAASEVAAQRAAAFAKRQQEAEKASARVRERIAERERSGKSAAPLPPPPSATALR